jgi:phospholipid/cholesterol/gamma-HCH transport system substrate-binding protein
MDERVMQFRVGVVFLATFLITAILLVLFGKLPSYIGGTYDIQILLSDASGVTKDTPLRKSGLLIGRVESVQLIDRDSKALVTAKVQDDKVIYQNEDCWIARNLLSGDTALSFIPNPNKPGAGKPIQRDVPLVGKISEDPTGVKRVLEDALKSPIDTVNSTGKALTAASEQLGKAAQKIEEIFDPETQRNAKSVLRDAAASLKTIQSVLGDEASRKKLTDAMAKLPDTLDNMNHAFHRADETLGKFTERSPVDGKTPVERMVGAIDMTERTLRKFSQPAREGELAPTEQIAKAMENINDITSLMRTIVTRIEQGEGSLGALMNDRQLYDRLNRAAKNIEEVSRELKPIMDDARVFSDKIARHPGVIVRDAVKPGVGIK